MSPDESHGVDATTDTDDALLARASESEPEPASARHMAAESEHPPGHTAPEQPASESDYRGPAVRREIKSA